MHMLPPSFHSQIPAENKARKLTPEDADDLRGRVCGILRRAKVPRSNLTKDQRTALKELRRLEDEMILPADRENETVDARDRNLWEAEGRPYSYPEEQAKS